MTVAAERCTVNVTEIRRRGDAINVEWSSPGIVCNYSVSYRLNQSWVVACNPALYTGDSHECELHDLIAGTLHQLLIYSLTDGSSANVTVQTGKALEYSRRGSSRRKFTSFIHYPHLFFFIFQLPMLL